MIGRLAAPPSGVALVLAVLMAGAAHAEDVLVIRDGTRRKGAVAGCREDACTLNGAKVARGLIAWVGLRQVDAAPPRARDPLKDEVHLVEGRVVTGEFGGLSLGAVAIADESFDRDEVAWIRFAGPEPAPKPSPSPRGPNYRFSPEPPAASPPGPSPPPRPSPPATPPPSPGSSPPPPPRPGQTPSSGACGPVPEGHVEEDGGRWVGRMKGQHATGGLLVHSSIEARLRECRYRWKGRAVVGVVEYSKLVDDGSVVTRNYSTTPSYRGPCTHWGAGTGRVSGERGQIVRLIQGVGPRGEALWSEYTYVVGVHPDREIPYTVSCGGSEGPQTYAVNDPGGWGVSSALGPVRLRPLTGGSMIGSHEESIHTFSSWSICREGTDCPPPPEPGPTTSSSPSPSPDPCGDLARARSLVDLLWDQRQLYARQLEAEWNRLQQAHREMLDNVEAYKAAIDACAIWDIVSETLESASGWAGEFMEFGTKVLSGDLSAFVGAEPWKSLSERAWDVFPRSSTWAGLMRDRVNGCGAPIPADLRAAALRFVDSWERVRGLMPAVQEKLNRIRTQDQKYWDEWQKYHLECLRHAQCKGLPPSTCPAPPESPSGPMPRESP